MSVEKCENCGENFRLIKNEMGWPIGLEVETYHCPYCKHMYRRKIRGSFSTEKINEE
jgi:hypothetical protein